MLFVLISESVNEGFGYVVRSKIYANSRIVEYLLSIENGSKIYAKVKYLHIYIGEVFQRLTKKRVSPVRTERETSSDVGSEEGREGWRKEEEEVDVEEVAPPPCCCCCCCCCG